MKEVDSLKSELRRRKPKLTISQEDLLSTGSTLVNIACTGKAAGGYCKGKYYLLVGDSSAGKTWACLSAFAEAAKNPNFENYTFIYDNAEDGALMDMRFFFGKKMFKRLKAPLYDDQKEPIYSETIEEFYYNLDDVLKKGQPVIYILDSMDSLSSKAEEKKFQEQKKAYKKQAKTAGSYTDDKAKKNSSNIRRIRAKLKRTGSILIIVCQTRDAMGFGFEDQTFAGGRSLKFYATLQLWMSIVKTLKKKYKDKDREMGVMSRVKIKKNRMTGRRRQVDIPIYHSFGIDDLGSCVDYLVKEGHWKMLKGVVNAPELDVQLPKEKLIAHIEETEQEWILKSAVAKVFQEIEEALSIKRKPRYS